MSDAKRKFLSIPDVIEANDISVGSQVPSGIISKIRSLVSDVTSYVNSSSDPTRSDVNTLVNWDKYLLLPDQTAYAQVEFKYGYVYPTSYSLKGYNANWCFAKEWYLYGFNQENGRKILLSENKSEGSTFCSTSSGCNNNNWATFSIKQAKKAFKYFRLVSKTPSCGNSSWYILLSGFEIFGIYSVNGRVPAKARGMTLVLFNKFSFCSIFLLVLILCSPSILFYVQCEFICASSSKDE